MSNEGDSEQVVELHSTQPGGGSISHCSLTGKINRDLLTHRERTPPPNPPLSCTQREALGLIFFPSNTGNSRNSQVDKSPPAHPTCCSFFPSSAEACAAHKRLLFKRRFAFHLLSLCIVAATKPAVTQSKQESRLLSHPSFVINLENLGGCVANDPVSLEQDFLRCGSTPFTTVMEIRISAGLSFFFFFFFNIVRICCVWLSERWICMNLGRLVEGVTSRHSWRAFCTTWLRMSIDLIEAAALVPSDRCVSITAFYAHFAAAEETNKIVKQITSSIFPQRIKNNIYHKETCFKGSECKSFQQRWSIFLGVRLQIETLYKHTVQKNRQDSWVWLSEWMCSLWGWCLPLWFINC